MAADWKPIEVAEFVFSLRCPKCGEVLGRMGVAPERARAPGFIDVEVAAWRELVAKEPCPKCEGGG